MAAENDFMLTELFVEKSTEFNMLNCHHLLKLSYALTLSNMMQTFAEMKPKQDDHRPKLVILPTYLFIKI